MRIGIMVGPETRRYEKKVDQMVDDARAADELGFATAWIPQLPQDFDAMTAVALMGRETTRIELGTAVVPLQSRHPIALGQQALSVQSVCGGRFSLGVGPSHHWIVDSMLGLPYEQPAKLVEDYLDVFDAMFSGPDPVDVENDRFRIHNPLDVTDLPVPVLLAALGPVMLRIAGERAAGTVLWMADERAIADHVVPRITKAAEGAGRPAPRVVAGVAVCLCAPDEVDGAIERANEALGHAEYSPNYQRLLEQGDASDVGDMAAIGTEADIERRLRSYATRGHDRLLGAHPAARQGTRRDRRLVASHAGVPGVVGTRAHMRGDLLWRSLPAMAADAGARFGDAVAVIDGDRRISYTELVGDARRVTGALAASGIAPGSASRSGRPTATSGWSARSASSVPVRRWCR